MRARLAASLDGIVETLDGALDTDAASVNALTAAIRAHPVRPGVMALYADLVPALMDDADRAAEILAELRDPVWRRPAAPRVATVGDDALGRGMAACYMHHLNDDPEAPLKLSALDAAALRAGGQQVASAMQLLHRACPDLAAEIAALINEVLLVGPAREPGALSFHGASSFYLWGALLLNLEAHDSRVQLIVGFAHESSHSILHGLTMGAPLVRNDPAERYASPLREDKRPMDGVVHATYVLARMHLALAMLLRCEDVTGAEREDVAARLHAAAGDYAAGLAIVDRHARFTDQGAAIFAGARDYMAAATNTKTR